MQRLATVGEVIELTEFAAAPLLGFRLKRYEPPKPLHDHGPQDIGHTQAGVHPSPVNPSYGQDYDVAVDVSSLGSVQDLSGEVLQPVAQDPGGTPGVYVKTVEVTDGARALAEEHGVDLSTVQGSGAGGRVTKQDVRRAVGDA